MDEDVDTLQDRLQGARQSRVNGRMMGAMAANASDMTQICIRFPAPPCHALSRLVRPSMGLGLPAAHGHPEWKAVTHMHQGNCTAMQCPVMFARQGKGIGY